MAMEPYKTEIRILFSRKRRESDPLYNNSPDNIGFLLAALYPGCILLPAATALFGIPGILYDEYIGSGPRLYVHNVSYEPLGIDDANPIGIQRAASAFLRSRFGLFREADCMDAAIHNVLEAGWRTSDISMINFPRISMSAMGKLISEQIQLAGNFMNQIIADCSLSAFMARKSNYEYSRSVLTLLP